MTESSNPTASDATETTTSDNADPAPSAELNQDTLMGGENSNDPKPAEGDDSTAKEKEGDKTEDGKEAEGEEEYVPLTAETLEIPEGFELPDERMASALEVINKYQLPPEAITDFMKLNVDWAKEDATSAQNAGVESWNNLMEGWADEIKNDPTYGGEHLDKNLGKIADLIDTFSADKEGNVNKEEADQLKAVMNLTGVGNSLPLMRFLTRIADFTLVTEADPMPGSEDAPTGQTSGLYQHLK